MQPLQQHQLQASCLRCTEALGAGGKWGCAALQVDIRKRNKIRSDSKLQIFAAEKDLYVAKIKNRLVAAACAMSRLL